MTRDVWDTQLEPLLTEKQAAEILNIKPKTLSRWRWQGEGPIYRKIGGAVRYSVDDLKEFIEKGSRQVTQKDQRYD